MWVIYLADYSHEMSSFIFSEKKSVTTILFSLKKKQQQKKKIIRVGIT